MKWQKRQAALLLSIARFVNNQAGQALREYALVVAIVAVTAVITLATLGFAVAGSLPAPVDGLIRTLENTQQQP